MHPTPKTSTPRAQSAGGENAGATPAPHPGAIPTISLPKQMHLVSKVLTEYVRGMDNQEPRPIGGLIESLRNLGALPHMEGIYHAPRDWFITGVRSAPEVHPDSARDFAAVLLKALDGVYRLEALQYRLSSDIDGTWRTLYGLWQQRARPTVAAKWQELVNLDDEAVSYVKWAAQHIDALAVALRDAAKRRLDLARLSAGASNLGAPVEVESERSLAMRMAVDYAADQSRLAWTSEQWAKHLGCSERTVRRAHTWKRLKAQRTGGRDRFRETA